MYHSTRRREAYGRTHFLGGLLLLGLISSVMTSLTIPACFAGETDQNGADLSRLSLEELMNIEVTTVSKKAENLFDASAAVYVVTQEDIRRTGARSIPDALRMVPGLHVAQIDGNITVVAARGFSDRYANKLLVLIDGRSVYTPSYSGVWWDVQDTLVEDIDRIEVIRGPGATMWGANAVNGVINIITKSASDSQGLLLATGFDGLGKGNSQIRQGGSIGDKGSYRFYTKSFNQGASYGTGGLDAVDDRTQSQTGFRMDLDLADNQSFTFQGDAYNGSGGQKVHPLSYAPPFSAGVADDPYDVSGMNLLARWNRTVSEDADSSLQLYFDRTDRENNQYQETRNTFDIDFQQRQRKGTRQEFTWGLGYRLNADSTDWPAPWYDPAENKQSLLSAFLQDDIVLRPSKTRLTVGSKFEHNAYTGFEVQPSVQLLYTPDSQHTMWTAVSRAVRTPNRSERDAARVDLSVLQMAPEAPIALLRLLGNSNFTSEHMTAYEAGYRVQPSSKLSLDVATYYNKYHDLRTVEQGVPYFDMSPVPHAVMPAHFENNMSADVYGIELAANWQPSQRWRLSGTYSYMKADCSVTAGSTDTPETYEGASPANQFGLRSYLDLPKDMEFDTMLYYVGKVKSHDIPSYLRLDMRLGWQLKNGMSLSIGGQNLLDSHHPEFGATTSEIPTEVERTYYARATWSL